MSVEFVDTNILVYAHAEAAGVRHHRAADLIDDLWERNAGALSTQILAEFYSTVTGKLRMTSERAEHVLRPLAAWTIHRPSHADILSSIHLQRRHQLSWWDAMVVNSAIQLDSRILWTEDLNHGQRFGDLIVQNPFA